MLCGLIVESAHHPILVFWTSSTMKIYTFEIFLWHVCVFTIFLHLTNWVFDVTIINPAVWHGLDNPSRCNIAKSCRIGWGRPGGVPAVGEKGGRSRSNTGGSSYDSVSMRIVRRWLGRMEASADVFNNTFRGNIWPGQEVVSTWEWLMKCNFVYSGINKVINK